MEPIIAAVKAAGVVRCRDEHDQSTDAIAGIKQSMAYLSKM